MVRSEATVTHDTIRILLVDDHAVVRAGMRAFFDAGADLEVVAEAADGERAIHAAGETAPDVAFVDLLMPGLGGVECTRQLKQVSPTTQVIILTSYHRDEHIFPAIRAGALSYLLKDASPEAIADAARRAVRGETTLHPRVATRVMHELQHADRSSGRSPFTLTERETDVLKRIAEGEANRSIAETFGISEKTVKRHVSNILSKLHLADRTQAAVYAWRQGLVDPS
ncbi:MAG: response regulator transcription factor [Acidobacteriota bacterium]